MRQRATHTIVFAGVLLLCRTAVDQGAASVVLGGGTAISNPAIEVGGHRLPPQPPPAIPYSVIGAIVSEGSWLMQCALEPWRQFGSLRWFGHHRSFDGHRFERIPPRVLKP
jgi:hypothetical protein